jgi:primary-amine oxidase
MKLTGIMSTMAIEEGAELRHARRIGRQLAAPHHQHLFCFRLDFDVDGPANTVVEIEAEPCPAGPDNPLANTWIARETPIRRESEGVRDADPSRARHWEVRNPNVRNRWGEPVAYRIKPGHGTTRLLALDESAVTRRAQFAKHNLWVTAYDPEERKAAGDYPNQHAGGDGLPRFVAADRPLENTDIVVWLTIGSTHIARPEDWPVMPVEYTGFLLQPVGFFDRNPAMNLPPSNGHHCR